MAKRSPGVDVLMWVWLLVVLVFFSIPKSKLVGYAAPALLPLAYLLAQPLARLDAGSRPAGSAIKWSALVASALCFGAVAAVPMLIKGSPQGIQLSPPAGFRTGDRVVMLDNYFYSIPFYWRLREPVVVAGLGTPEFIAQRDNWRKELFDAGRFEPQAAQRLLVDSHDLPAACSERPTWVLSLVGAHVKYPWLLRARFIGYGGNMAVWRFDPPAHQIGCAPGTDGAERP